LIKTIISILITLAVLNACARMGMAAFNYFQLKDEANQIILFGSRSSTDQLHDRIVEYADGLGVPLYSEDLYVTREGDHTYVDGYYTQPVDVFPGVTVPVDLSFSVETVPVRDGRIQLQNR
jgi:hypothetical protein